MNKKLINFILIIMLCLSINTVHASYFADVLNESVTDTLDIYHKVDRQSEFRISFFRTIVDDGSTDVASFRVINNTVDGYQVLFKSQNGGTFSPASTLDGETDIPYSISITFSGELGTNTTSYNSLSNTTLSSSTDTPILSVSNQTSPTDVEATVTVEVNDTNNQFMMAGDYSDTVTITYVDN